MSQAAVHHPSSYGKSRTIVKNGQVTAVGTPSNGLIWQFSVGPTTRPASDFDWVYSPSGGSPATPINDSLGFSETFSGAGLKTVTLTVSGTNGIPANGTYVLGVNAKAGAIA